MGLLFALDPDNQKSSDSRLLLRSSKKRKGLAMGFMIGGVFLGTMFFAAKPLFDKFLEEGELFDKAVSIFFYVMVFIYPVLAILSTIYEQQVNISKTENGFLAEKFHKIAFVTWAKERSQFATLKDLKVKNWKGSVNTAAVKAAEKGESDRYATRGHWMLEVEDKDNAKSNILERRARKDDVEWLLTQIEGHFKVS